MKNLRKHLLEGILVCILLFVFSLQAQRFTGEKQRSFDIGYLEGYKDGRTAMKIEFEDQMKAIKHARKMARMGFEIDDAEIKEKR